MYWRGWCVSCDIQGENEKGKKRNKEGEEREAKEVVLEYLRLVNFYCNEAGASCCLVM